MSLFTNDDAKAKYQEWVDEQLEGLGPDDEAPDTSEEAYLDWLLTTYVT